MRTFQKPKPKQLLLWGILIIVTILVLRQYLPGIKLPTKGRIQELQSTLISKKSDLAVQNKINDDWQAKILQLQKDSNAFWERKKPSTPVEQEVSDEFRDILRIASVNVQRQTAKLIKNTNSQFIQEVEIEIQMSGTSMQEFARLLREIANNHRKLIWTYCKIEPENPNAPSTIKIQGRLKAYVLGEDAVNMLKSDFGSSQPTSTDSKSPAPRTNNRRGLKK